MTGVLRHPQKSQGPERHWGHDISNFGAHYGELTEIMICECLNCNNNKEETFCTCCICSLIL